MRRLPLLIILVLMAGCQVGTLPDPNDPINDPMRAGDLLRKKMKATSDLVNERVAAREITPEQGMQIMTIQAGEELDRLKNLEIPAVTAWQFGEVAITAKRWTSAEKFLSEAIKFEKSELGQDPNVEDRYINDSLRLAHCEAERGDLAHALETTRSVFDAPPHWKWPILYAVYLEVVPAAERMSPGHELELCELLQDAIKQHEFAQGDPNNPREANWVEFRDFHIRKAYELAAQLYKVAHRDDLAKEALDNADHIPHPTSL